jgi:hypothetical protein
VRLEMDAPLDRLASGLLGETGEGSWLALEILNQRRNTKPSMPLQQIRALNVQSDATIIYTLKTYSRLIANSATRVPKCKIVG